jgi:hypothetical protein
MTDFVQLQDDIGGALLEAESLADVNVLVYRRLRLQSEISRDVLWQSQRNGKCGAGVLVEMPEFRVQSPNLPGPEAELTLTVLVQEEPNINMTAGTGTLLSAEEICQRVLDVLHHWMVNGFGQIVADSPAILPVEGEEVPPGIIAYRIAFKCFVPREQTRRVDQPTITEDALEITIANAAGNASASIYYTLDGTFPGASNPTATLYSAPFTVVSGAVIRFAAYQSGWLPSIVNRVTIT